MLYKVICAIKHIRNECEISIYIIMKKTIRAAVNTAVLIGHILSFGFFFVLE